MSDSSIAQVQLAQTPAAFLMTYVKARRASFLTLGALVVAAGSCAVAVQYGMKLIVDAMSATDRQAADVWHPLFLFLTLIGVESILWRLSGWLGCRTIIASCVDMRVDLFKHLTGHSMKYFRQHLSGALGNRITSTSQASGSILGTLTWNIVPPCVDFLGAVVVLLTIDWRMAAALTGFVALVAGVIFTFGSRGRVLHQEFGEQASRVGGEIVDAVSNIWVVQAFSARHRETERLQKELGVEARAQRRSWMYLEKARVLHDICLWIMAGTMLTWALRSWQAGTVTAGDVVVISALAFRILHGSRDLALALVGTAQQFGVIAEMLNVVAQPHDQPDLPELSDKPIARGTIELRNVNYAYADGRQVFNNLSLTIPAGQKVGIVGPSGAGKSTLLSLLQRVDDVGGGCILIDGERINEMSRDSLRQAIGVVPQDISLFRRSVLENIRYGRPDATKEEVIACAKKTHCDEFIRALKHGYKTIVGERGASLSGGQRQRIGIARALLKDAPILLLDEATSALDSQSEALINSALIDLMKDRTVVAAAHRLSTLSRYDRIVVLADGHVIEDGTLEELRNAGGMFSQLWALQTIEGDCPPVPEIAAEAAASAPIAARPDVMPDVLPEPSPRAA
ncbi:ABC transporter ATP-binding protein [Pigmentiphaga litoralis]|uniref:ABC transporter ATP-binding protein n=1 Tax=Pigmentiphaga litoralis TaxID=516702 RepID=UPI0016718C73|nr:ABC transporter ATP-binding protein [Pigmentiphaga litoralis]GGX03953.1 ABC transporter ATP-binding protein [Pigmentiphaga litoralis]